MNEYRVNVMEKNSSLMYKWTVKPTEKWAGGSLPIDLVYQIHEFGTGKMLVKGGFTIAYPYISNEYYEGKTPVSKESAIETQTPAKSTPAFTTLGTLLSVTLALIVFRH